MLPRKESGQNGRRCHKEAGRGAAGRAHRRLGFSRRRRVQRGDRLPGSRPVREAAIYPSDDRIRSSAHVDAGAPGAGGEPFLDIRRQGAAWRQDPRERYRREKSHGHPPTLGQRRRDKAGARGGRIRATDDRRYAHRGRRRGVLLRRRRQPVDSALRLLAAEDLEHRDVLLRAKVGRRATCQRANRGLPADEGGCPLVCVDALFLLHLRAIAEDALQLKSRKH